MIDSKPFYFEKEPESPTLCHPNNGEMSPTLSRTSRHNPEMTGMTLATNKEKKNKTYFKLAKSMQLRGKAGHHHDAIEDLMKSSQFERKKDLTNLRQNAHH